MSKSTKNHKVHKETETMASSKQKNKPTETICKKKKIVYLLGKDFMPITIKMLSKTKGQCGKSKENDIWTDGNTNKKKFLKRNSAPESTITTVNISQERLKRKCEQLEKESVNLKIRFAQWKLLILRHRGEKKGEE